MLAQFLRFGLVGALATLLHMTIGVTLIGSGWEALSANVIAFPVAFLVSFLGHSGFSFADHDMPMARALRRFLLVAVAGFAVNEMLLALLLWTGMVAQAVALVAATGCAALFSFAVSRNWAFRKAQPAAQVWRAS